jgi:hypothetical protein
MNGIDAEIPYILRSFPHGLDSLSTQDFQRYLMGGRPVRSPSSGESFLDTEYHVEMMTKKIREREHRYKV